MQLHIGVIGCFLCYFATIITGSVRRYDDFKVYDYVPRTKSQLRRVDELYRSSASFSEDLVFWKFAPKVNKTGTFMVSSRYRNRIIPAMQSSHIPLHMRHDNVQRLVSRQRRQNRIQQLRNFQRTSFRREPHTYFMRYSEIINWMRTIAQRCISPLKCTLTSVGKSHENRDIYVIKISNGNGRKKFWIDAGIHPREWIASSTGLYLIKKLTEYGSDAKAMLDRFEFHIMPMINPDGYEYTHTHSRFWRKNRKPSDYYCMGVDLNRNFGFNWGGMGSSENPCAENYRGLSAFSEAETRVLRNYLKRNNRTMLVFLTLHSYGQYILIPYGHRKDYYPVNKKQLMTIGQAVAQQISINSGRFYEVGSAADLLYEASGGSTDYASATLNIPYTYTFELPDTGRYAFFLPPQYIKQVGNEMWSALKQMIALV